MGLCVQFALCALSTLLCVYSAANTQTRFSQVRRLSAQQYEDGYNIQPEHFSTSRPASTHRPLFHWDTGILKPKVSLQLEPSYVRMNKFDIDDKKMDNYKLRMKNRRKNTKHLKDKNNVWWPWESYSEWLASHRANQMNNTSVTIQEKESDDKLNFKRAKQEMRVKRKRNRMKKKRRKMQGKMKKYRLLHERVEGQTKEKRKESLGTMISNNFDVSNLQQNHVVNWRGNDKILDKNRNSAASIIQLANILPNNSNKTPDVFASEAGKVDHNIEAKSAITDFKHDDMDEHILGTRYYSTVEQDMGATVLTATEATETTPSTMYGKNYLDNNRDQHTTFEGPEGIKIDQQTPLQSEYVLRNATAPSVSILHYTNRTNSLTNPPVLNGTMDDFIQDPERTNLIQPIVNLNPSSKHANHALFNHARINYTQDLNECAVDNGGCEGLCINTRGSYHCHCPAGFRLANNNKQCLDINECLLRNGHGPCEGECINRWGSYECRCLGSTRLAADGHSCQHIDQCEQGGCSHHCISTRAGPFCTCPDGHVLGNDWKTCQDIDECKMSDMQSETCLNGCVNTVGSYYCL